MKEEELAEQFSRELDEAFSGGGKPAGLSPDPGAMAAAAKLARADFSGDSAIKETLRAELLARAGETSAFGRFALLFRRSGWLQTAIAAACLTLVMLPVLRQGRTPVAPGASSAPRAAAPALRISSAAVPGGIRTGGPAVAVQAASRHTVAARQAAAEPARALAAVGGPGMFRSVPMRLTLVRPSEFPIETTKGASPFGRVTVKKLAVQKGSGVVWETEHAVFTIESREISPDELFQRKAI